MPTAPDEDLCQRLPLPLAKLYRRARNATDPVARHFNAFYLWEATLRMTASAAIVEVLERGQPNPKLANVLRNLERPALGHWWELVRTLLPLLAQTGDAGYRTLHDFLLTKSHGDLPLSADLHAALLRELKGQDSARRTVRLRELFDRIVEYRNEVLGHANAGGRPKSFHEQMAQVILAGVGEMLSRLDVLAGRRLVYVGEVTRLESGRWQARRYELRGESARIFEAPSSVSRVEVVPVPRRIYLESESEGGPARCLHPLLLYDEEHEAVFFLRSYPKGLARVEYDDLLQGRVVEREKSALASCELLDRVLGGGRADNPIPLPDQPDPAAEKRKQPLPAQGQPSPTDQAPIANLLPELANNTQYEVLRELGRGGMGVVYLARHRLSGRLEVLKVMNKELLARPGSRERFLREIQSAARLDHANVVKMYTALELGDLMVLVMEYVEGESLAEYAKKQGPLPVMHACSYVQQAALGLQHAFEKKMVHRDIKPQNLMLAREGKKPIVKILDFGLAKATREEGENTALTDEGAMLGTPDYVAPEQALDAAAADIRADIYSLDCTLYYLLAGMPPFPSKSLSAVLLAHQSVEAKPLNLVRPEVPEELAAVVRKMMAKDPAQRYQTPAEVVQALGLFGKQEAKGPPPKSTHELSIGAAQAERPMEPARAVAKQQATVIEEPPAVVRDTRTEDSITSAEQRPSGALRKRRPPVRKPSSKQKWLIGGRIGVGLLLLGLLGLWAGGAFTGKTPDGTKESAEGKPAKTPDGGLIKELSKAKPAPLPNSITNSIDMKLVLVKPGTFLMGSPPTEAGRSDEEQQHEVEITRSFYMGVYEVTQEQYERVMGMNPSYFSAKGGGKDNVQGMDTHQFPVENVSWEDAVEFCRQLSERPEEKSNGRVYRLPTEAEWEYVCRGGHLFKNPSPPFSFGNSLSSTQANYNGLLPYGGAVDGPYLERTTKVGSYPPNPLGLYDLHGNVWEWCADWYDPEYYKRSPRQNPQGPEREDNRVLRGGSWSETGRDCRAAYRDHYAPGDRGNYIGFRVVLLVGAKN